MGNPKVTQTPKVKILIGGIDVETDYQVLEWMAFASGGYVMRARISDPYLNFLAKLAKQQLLRKARKEPLECRFKIGWAGGDEMDEMKAWVTDVGSSGVQVDAETEIIAIDPPSWALNAGYSDGIVFEGKVSDVISQVCKRFTISAGGTTAPILEKISETKDNDHGKWWMMRQDPKTFIQMLLDWSSALTNRQTNWVINAKNEKLHIVEQAELVQNDFKKYDILMTTGYGRATDLIDISVQSDTLLTFWQTRLNTGGVSAISGKYYDKITAKEQVEVYDENTSNKIDAKSTPQESFDKPNPEGPNRGGWSTSILTIPEHNAGDVGVEYGDYMHGRPRHMFIEQLSLMHRIRIKVHGDADVRDPLGLEATIVNLNWKNEKGDRYWLGGKWIVYGFHHMVTRGKWTTDLYLRRFDHDAAAKKR